MQIHRPMSAGIIRPSSLFLIIIVGLSLLPMLSHGAVFWDDEMDQGNTQFYYAPHFTGGAYTFDTSVKFSGTGSIRLHYPPACETAGTTNIACGGELSRGFPPRQEVYRRVYFRMSGAGPTVSDSGLFETSVVNFTKLLRTTTQGLRRQWWSMGCCRSKRWLLAEEHVPIGGATNVFSSIILADNRWYCLETREKLSTPGVADGIHEGWVDGVQVLDKRNYINRIAGSTDLWERMAIFRQSGRGNIWWDRYAAGDTRIGCLGTGSPDTSPPAPPQELIIR